MLTTLGGVRTPPLSERGRAYSRADGGDRAGPEGNAIRVAPQARFQRRGTRMAKVLVVTSGKGGVGKTTSTAALGAALAQGGEKVVVVDFDVGLRNLDLIMGAERRVVYDLINVAGRRQAAASAHPRQARGHPSPARRFPDPRQGCAHA